MQGHIYEQRERHRREEDPRLREPWAHCIQLRLPAAHNGHLREHFTAVLEMTSWMLL